MAESVTPGFDKVTIQVSSFAYVVEGHGERARAVRSPGQVSPPICGRCGYEEDHEAHAGPTSRYDLHDFEPEQWRWYLSWTEYQFRPDIGVYTDLGRESFPDTQAGVDAMHRRARDEIKHSLDVEARLKELFSYE